MSSLRKLVLTACLAGGSLVGCGSSTPTDLPNLAPVTGIVTQKGQPLAGALVVFEPKSGGPASSGVTGDDGRFELQYNAELKGAVPGSHKVRVSKLNGEGGDELIPAKFNTRSELQQQVAQPGPNEIKIEI